MKKIFLLLLSVIATNANADPTVNYFLENKSSVIVEAFVTGAGQGMITTNTMLKFKKSPQLFCPPSTLSINYANLVSIIESEVKKQGIAVIGNEIVTPFLMMGFISTFPCKK